MVQTQSEIHSPVGLPRVPLWAAVDQPRQSPVSITQGAPRGGEGWPLQHGQAGYYHFTFRTWSKSKPSPGRIVSKRLEARNHMQACRGYD